MWDGFNGWQSAAHPVVTGSEPGTAADAESAGAAPTAVSTAGAASP